MENKYTQYINVDHSQMQLH